MFNKKSDDSFNNSSVIGESVVIDGDFCCDEDIIVFGKVNGLIKTSKAVFIKSSAVINADIKANSVSVDGEVIGNIDSSEFINISASSIVNGNLSTKVISIDNGAVFNGKCSIKKDSKKVLEGSDSKNEPTLDKKTDSKKTTSSKTKKKMVKAS